MDMHVLCVQQGFVVVCSWRAVKVIYASRAACCLAASITVSSYHFTAKLAESERRRRQNYSVSTEKQTGLDWQKDKEKQENKKDICNSLFFCVPVMIH